ncbi:uncharacterized protein PFL1_02859 [Pseudozyma flocculosa PF-1]|uniref:Hydrophobic surface binding protein n=2 Tax=Pseudozyma flocculosa TaxID=84751 RepID=A0A5C3F2S9_9BASI|nr:uncharacterized protein PFL1_02859 [Pseudozyma flocculosa PF-1]EPQ29639.1 hypothetical protein PFL1_02859 [Pseudozyma flocculosa PF-1]SPO38206.1 uncharacterized protein PSFLO_03683 [Pseudozyma flocculosa]
MKFFITFAALACLFTVVLADFATVLKDIDDVNAKLSTLNKRLQGTDGTDYFADLAITGDVDNLVKSLDTATKDFGAIDTVSVDQADQVLDKLQTSKTTSTATVDRLIAIKPGFQKAGVVGLVQSNVNKLATSVNGFADAAVAKTPAERKTQAQSLRDSIVGDITRAQKAYA